MDVLYWHKLSNDVDSETMPTLWLIRHGETEWNLKRRFQGSSDEPLNTTGEEQAACLTPRLEKMSFDAIYASDMLRVQQTAKFALNGDISRMQSDARLREVGFGKWEGLTWGEIKEQYPEDFEIWSTDRSLNPHGGDSLADVVGRIDSFLADIQAKYSKEDQILIFAHGGSLAILITRLLGIDSAKWWQFILKNCALTEIKIFTHGVVLSRFNDDKHLPEAPVGVSS